MKRSLNLIPIATQRRQALRRIVRVWTQSLVLSGACVALLLGLEWARGMSAVRRLNEMEARYAPLEQLIIDQDGLTKRIARLEAREELSLRLSRDTRGISLLGAVARAAGDSDGSVYIERLDYKGPSVTAVRGGGAGQSLRLEGAGRDGAAVSDFATRLRESGVFDSVAVESTRPLTGAGASSRRYVVACTF